MLKQFVILALLATSALCRTDQEYSELFAKWKATHNKVYQSPIEEAKRFQYFKARAEYNDAWNAIPDQPYTRGLTLEADEEFPLGMDLASHVKRATWAGTWNSTEATCYDWSGLYCKSGSSYIPSTGKTYPTTNLAAIPSGLSSVVTTPRDQTSTNLCWAYTAIASLESCYAIKTGELKYLSIQQMVDFASTSYSGHCPKTTWDYLDGYYSGSRPICLDWRTCGTATNSGGWPQTALSYHTDVQVPSGVILSETDYPLTCTSSSGSTTARSSPDLTLLSTSHSDKVHARLTGYTTLKHPSSLLAELQKGPVAVCISKRSGLSFGSYTGGVWVPNNEGSASTDDCYTPTPAQITHCVLAVGYAKDGSSNVHYFIKNQYVNNPTWGESGNPGYGRIAQTGVPSTCTHSSGTNCGTCGIGGYYVRADCQPLLINFDCTGGGISSTSKQGKAATGFKSTDKWNTITQNWSPWSLNYPGLGSIVYADNTIASGVSITVNTNGGSYWDNPNSAGQDPMFWRYIYTDHSSGQMTVKVSGLPVVSSWSVYLYGKAYDTVCGDQNTNFTVQVFDASNNAVSTLVSAQSSGSARPWDTSNPQPSGGSWSYPTHYSVVHNVVVASGNSILITAIKPTVSAGCPAKPVINGFQLLGHI